MKTDLPGIIFLMIFKAGLSQLTTIPTLNAIEKPGVNGYYLSSQGAISDASVDMNSTTFGTDNTSVI